MLKVANSVINASQIATPITFAGNVTLSTGNLVIGTAGKGIDFSATSGTGTSELLADYEEGTWTPVDSSGAGLTFTNTSNNCFYTKIGNLVTCGFNVTYPVTASVAVAVIGGLPFTSQATTSGIYGGILTFTNVGVPLTLQVDANTQLIYPYIVSTSANATNVQFSEKIIRGIVTYRV